MRLAAAEDQQVGERIGPGGPAVRSGRESNRADEVGELSHLPARGGVGGVERVVAGQQRHQPAGACQRERLDDEVVVQAVSGPVVRGVVQSHVGEGDVPDRQIEVAVRQPRVRERLGADIRGGMKRSGYRGGRGVEFHTGQLRAVGREREEHARAAARLEHAPGAESELCDQSPHLAGDCGVGVVRVDRRPPRGRVRLLVEQLAELLAIGRPLLALLVEDLGDRSPASPSGQATLLIDRRVALLALEGAQDAQGVEVGVDAGASARGRQLVLRARCEPQLCGSSWSISLIVCARSRMNCTVPAGPSCSSSLFAGSGMSTSSLSTRSSAASRAMFSRPTFSR